MWLPLSYSGAFFYGSDSFFSDYQSGGADRRDAGENSDCDRSVGGVGSRSIGLCGLVGFFELVKETAPEMLGRLIG